MPFSQKIIASMKTYKISNRICPSFKDAFYGDDDEDASGGYDDDCRDDEMKMGKRKVGR